MLAESLIYVYLRLTSIIAFKYRAVRIYPAAYMFHYISKRKGEICLWNVKTGDIFLYNYGEDHDGSSVQSGFRPVIVVQAKDFNKHAPTVIVAAVTSSIKKTYMPSHIVLPDNIGLKYKSMVALEQLRTISKDQLGMYIGTVTDEEILSQIRAGISVMF